MTIHRLVKEQNLRSYRPLRYLPLTPTHYQARCYWCWARSSWNHANCACTMFSDKSCFQLHPDDHRRRVRRHPGQGANPAFTIVHHTGPQPGIMVWRVIPFDSQILEAHLQYSGTSTPF
ncbi:transposable element Tcb1 transposase [Trichonephila clavipes]|uniref:Transposable element Tcb1 transposase n=1 Tax=Trichonephila clavipes TaxID=2585209 RepID=A0A8X6S827_TRICX|nr:transposable element Tcb1 transposase [Trichonephila clavipes]